MGQVTSIEPDGTVKKQDFASFATENFASRISSVEGSKETARQSYNWLVKDGTRMKDWTATNLNDSMSCPASGEPCKAIQEAICGFDLVHLGIGPTVDMIRRDGSFQFVRPRRLKPALFDGCEMVDEFDSSAYYLMELLIDASINNKIQTVNDGEIPNAHLIQSMILDNKYYRYQVAEDWPSKLLAAHYECLKLVAACTGHTIQLVHSKKAQGEAEPDARIEIFEPDKYSSGVELVFRTVQGWNFWSRQHVGESTWPKEKEVPITVHNGPEFV